MLSSVCQCLEPLVKRLLLFLTYLHESLIITIMIATNLCTKSVTGKENIDWHEKLIFERNLKLVINLNLTTRTFFFFFLDIDDCANHRCANDASCVDGINSYLCNCTAGFTGAYCQTGESNVKWIAPLWSLVPVPCFTWKSTAWAPSFYSLPLSGTIIHKGNSCVEYRCKLSVS